MNPPSPTTAAAPPPPTSLRERKKAKTRAALIEVSQRLFRERGYSETTLEEICAEVEIRPQTLLRYFESKAHLAIAPTVDRLEPLRVSLRDPERRDDALTIFRRYITDEAQMFASDGADSASDIVHQRRTWEAPETRDPIVGALVTAAYRGVSDDLATAIAADHGVADDDLHSMLVATLVLAGCSAVYERWGRRAHDADALVDDLQAVIDYAVESLPRRTARRLHRIAAR